LGLVLNQIQNTSSPFGDHHPFYVLIETHGSYKEHDDEKLQALLESLMDKDLTIDGVLAQDDKQITSIWKLRESIAEACGRAGAVYKYDVSIPISRLYALVEDVRTMLREKDIYKEGGPVSDVIGYGHIGDGNLHLNIVSDDYLREVTDAVEPYIYEWIASENGSISAEHGLGVMKGEYIHYSKSKPMVSTMQKIKDILDPRGIINPYKLLPRK